MTTKTDVKPRSIQEWQERTGTNNLRLLAMIREQTGIIISPALLSSIKSKSRRCAQLKAVAISAVTGIPVRTLTKWPPESETSKFSGKGTKHAA